MLGVSGSKDTSRSEFRIQLNITSFAEQSIKEPAKWTCDAATAALNVVNSVWSRAECYVRDPGMRGR
jgi:hypothetical protein